jgi:hypothetical protein
MRPDDDRDVTEAEAIANVQEVFPSAKVMSVEPTREVRNERYRAGLCIDCGECPYAAGRPRCHRCESIRRGYNA